MLLIFCQFLARVAFSWEILLPKRFFFAFWYILLPKRRIPVQVQVRFEFTTGRSVLVTHGCFQFSASLSPELSSPGKCFCPKEEIFASFFWIIVAKSKRRISCLPLGNIVAQNKKYLISPGKYYCPKDEIFDFSWEIVLLKRRYICFFLGNNVAHDICFAFCEIVLPKRGNICFLLGNIIAQNKKNVLLSRKYCCPKEEIFAFLC